LSTDPAKLRQELWRVHTALARTLRRLQRAQPMVQGSFYLLRRKCGNPRCRCARGELHASWVITRSESGQHRTYPVPDEARALLRQLTAEYRRYQRARAVLVKRHQKMLALVDGLAELRLRPWPEQPPAAHG
jgi:hypothetical protein